ncbi:MAG: 3-phosphoshikimate 1-carboxyvinyltransferase [Treponema sp.]
MKLIVGAPHFHGKIRIPSSKSHTLRALICASLADSSSYIESPLESEDINTAVEILQSLGVRIRKLNSSPAVWKISPPHGGLIEYLNTYSTQTAEKPVTAGSAYFMQSPIIFSSQHTQAAESGSSVQSSKSVVPIHEPQYAAHSKVSACSEVSDSTCPEISTCPEVFDHTETQSPVFHHTPITLHLGNSGSLLYFLGATLAVSHCPLCFTGDASLQSRPIEPLLEIYRQAHLFYAAASAKAQAALPLTFCGALAARTFTLDGPFSQPVSGLLLAAPLLHGTTRIFFKNPGEVPYLHITCNWLRKAGIHVQAAQNGSSFTITGKQVYRALSETIPGDWSSAAFPLAAAIVSRQALTLENLDIQDGQGDARIVSLLQQMGAAVHYNAAEKTLSVLPVPPVSPNQRHSYIPPPLTLTGISCDCSDIPDAVPVLAALACFAQGQTYLTNAGVCRYKECDRLHVIAEELSRFGADITEGSDFLIIHGKGGDNLHPARVTSRHDHRIAMALAVAACGIGAITATASSSSGIPFSCVEHFDCAAVSYPAFIADLTAAGASFSLEA